MPYKPKHPCSHPGCPLLTNDRFCADHAKQHIVQYEKTRGTATQRGYDHRWHKASRIYLNEHPLCAGCLRQGREKGANTVDHIKPHHGDQILFWNQDNWQAMCKKCHDSKTAKEDGRWGSR